ncbi:hypothetical protein LH29_14660 [Draconibacterium sediminis]|uniref:Uncharacterized protein n=1 Tax=Draconibacterium sediminis TaxID=1544798 RepID=A0A0D8JCD8_9BACT|nr:hypothetical protein LH29_14660 [Draconibacterium sediminis]
MEYATTPAIKFNTCYLLGFVLTFIELLNFQISTVSILFFRLAKKAMENRQALLQFLVCVMAGANCNCAWLCGLALFSLCNFIIAPLMPILFLHKLLIIYYLIFLVKLSLPH